MTEIQIVYPYIKYIIFSLETQYFSCCLLHFIKYWVIYLGIYLKKNNKTSKQKKTKQTKTGKKRKKKRGEKESNEQHSNPAPSTRSDFT